MGIFSFRVFTMLLPTLHIYQHFLNINYKLILGYKGKTQELQLIFRKDDFRHLIGLQYLKDLQQLKHPANVIFERIQKQEILLSELEKSNHFHTIEHRILDFSQHFSNIIETLISGTAKIYRCTTANIHPNSKITADYMIVYEKNKNTFYLFLKKQNTIYTPISFFRKDKLDFEKNNPNVILMTILHSIEICTKFCYPTYKLSNQIIALDIQFDL